MRINIILLILISLNITSCADGIKNYLKRSANNKIIDSQGFQGAKRRPLYNKKHISIAKKNIREENFDADDDEDTSYENFNRQVYEEMIKQDQHKKKSKIGQYQSSYDKKYRTQDNTYPKLSNANKRMDKSKNNVNQDNVQDELKAIKMMLDETRKELSTYKCPNSFDNKGSHDNTSKNDDFNNSRSSNNAPHNELNNNANIKAKQSVDNDPKGSITKKKQKKNSSNKKDVQEKDHNADKSKDTELDDSSSVQDNSKSSSLKNDINSKSHDSSVDKTLVTESDDI